MRRKRLLFICPQYVRPGGFESSFFTNSAAYHLQAYLETLPSITDSYDLARVDLEMSPFQHPDDSFKDNIYHYQTILGRGPDILAFSLFCWSVSWLNELATALKQMAPDVLMIAGGPEVYERKRFCKQFGGFDILVEGDGELPLRAVLEKIAIGSSGLGDIPSVSFRTDGKWIHNPTRPAILDINAVPNFYKSLPEDTEGSGIYLASRGCPHGCDYCLWARQPWRVKNHDKIIEEIETLIDHSRIQSLEFFDYNFLDMYAKDRSLLQNISNILKRQDRVVTTAFFVNSEQLKHPSLPGVVQMLSTDRIWVGLQSGSAEVVRSVHRGWATASLEAMAGVDKQLLKHIVVELIYPLPHETPQGFIATLQRLLDMGYYRFQIFKLQVLRGSRLFRNAARLGLRYLQQPPYFCYQTPTSPTEITLKMVSLGKILTALPAALHDFEDQQWLQEYFCSDRSFLDRLWQAVDHGVSVPEIVDSELERMSGARPARPPARPLVESAAAPVSPPYQPLVAAPPEEKPGAQVSLTLPADDVEVDGDPRRLELKRWSRLLTAGLASHAHPPCRVDAFLAAGLHLRLHDRQGGNLHIKLTPEEITRTAWWRGDKTAVTIVTKKLLGEPHVSWLNGIVTTLSASAESSDGWPAFLRRASTTSEWSESSLAQALLRVTSNCNATCPFCNADSVAPDRCEGLDNVTGRLRELRAAGWQSVAFTGGEPTLLRELPQMVAAARQLGFSTITLQTNGVLLDDDERIQKLASAGLSGTLISIHAADAQLHDDIVGIRGAHRHALAAARKLVARNIRADVSFVMTSKNFSQAPALVEMLVGQLGCRMSSVVASYCSPEGRALDNLDWLPHLRDIREPLRQALDLARASNLDMVIPGQCGLPMCQLPEYLDSFDEFHHPQAAYMPTKSKTPACAECAFVNRCSGFWSVYLERFGGEELLPLRHPPGQEADG